MARKKNKIIRGLEQAVEHATAQSRVRTHLGLDAAHEGDPKGVRRFFDFSQGEIVMMIVATSLPEPVAERLKIVAREMQDAIQFLDGYCAAMKAQ